MPTFSPDALDPTSAELAKAGAEPISREAACRLLRVGDDMLPALLRAAQLARSRFKPGVITYSRKVFLPLTNLCRDYCGYCTFRRDPGTPGAHTMTPDEVMEVVHAGERMGCTEALFSLGDKPELAFPEMRDRLRRWGYNSTLHYLEAMCDKVLRESRLLPHPNPGLMSAAWLERLSRVAPSMGLMLETTSARLMAKGGAHENAPDKDPVKRLRVIEEAGRRKIPFTTGILIGIGETLEERVDALIAIRGLHETYGHIQEVIVQNFRAKNETPMARWPEPGRGEMLRTLAVARLLMPRMNIQAPPNLSEVDDDSEYGTGFINALPLGKRFPQGLKPAIFNGLNGTAEAVPYPKPIHETRSSLEYDGHNGWHYADLLDGGINDWGGVSPLTPDFINPEKRWPHLEELRRHTEAKGFELRQRLPVYPELVRQFTKQVLEPAAAPTDLLAQRLSAAADAEGYARRAE
ncbi:MAG: 7,8-didemethyl-8-hydroxy-5-deazariboflavin synthase CofG [Terriglobales bacterium]